MARRKRNSLQELEDLHGYIAEGNTYGALSQTSRPGVFVAGSATGPETIDDSIAQGTAAAMVALQQHSNAA